MALYDQHKVGGDQTFFGTKVWNPFLRLLDGLLAGKAPLEHVHGQGGGEVTVLFGTEAQRQAINPTAPTAWGVTDAASPADAWWLYRGGSPFSITNWVRCTPEDLAIYLKGQYGSLDLARIDHASYLARRPNAAYATLHAGVDGETHLVLPSCANTGSAERTVYLSGDGGTTDQVGFTLPEYSGPYALGGLVLDAAAAALALKGATDDACAFWAEIRKSPVGVKRLSGLAAGELFLAVPISSGTLATTHTATATLEVVDLFCGRKAGATSTKWCGAYGPTDAGADTLLATASLDALGLPVRLWRGPLKAGENVQVGGEAADDFYVWGAAEVLVP